MKMGTYSYSYDTVCVDDLRKLVRVEPLPRPQGQTWLATVVLNIARLSSLIFGIIQTCVEGTINFLNANGGVFGLFKRIILAKDLVDAPAPDSLQYLSIIAYQDPRVMLYMDLQPTPVRFPYAPPESRITADVCMMAAKLSYENEAVVKKVVEDVWQMNFVKFCGYYNEYLNMSATQAFICTDRKENAKAIMVAFRGTEPFNAYDWATDFNFALIPMENFGFSVHTGFLTGLFRATKSNSATEETHESFQSPESQSRLLDRVRASSEQQRKAHPIKDHEDAYNGISNILHSLLDANPDAKIYITGHSLGGALAALYGALLYSLGAEFLTNRLEAVYTFGQPRVGDIRFAQYLSEKMKTCYFRVVYSNDVVPRVGPDLPFRHCLPANYSSCLYTLVANGEEPHKNIYEFPIIGSRIVTMIELLMSILGRHNETNICLLSRIMALALPLAIAHSPVNYVNAIRSGPPRLTPPLAYKLKA